MLFCLSFIFCLSGYVNFSIFHLHITLDIPELPIYHFHKFFTLLNDFDGNLIKSWNIAEQLEGNNNA